MVSLPPRPSNSLKVPNRAGIGAGRTKARRVVDVSKIAAGDVLHREQGVRPDAGPTHRAGRQIDRDPTGGIGIDRDVVAVAAIEGVVAGRPSVSLPPWPSRMLLNSLPVMMSAKLEPRTRETPVKVSVPTEALPVAVPAARSTVTPAVALLKAMRVSPLPVMVSLPPRPSNSLNVPRLPALVLDPLKPVAS